MRACSPTLYHRLAHLSLFSHSGLHQLTRPAKPKSGRTSGNLRIGDQWNAITIIALSQSNPLKAVAELVENSIDAKAGEIVITRGKEKGQHYLRIKDDGEGIRRNADGEPDFHYVATHVCDSIKRQLKLQGTGGLQGEFVRKSVVPSFEAEHNCKVLLEEGVTHRWA